MDFIMSRLCRFWLDHTKMGCTWSYQMVPVWMIGWTCCYCQNGRKPWQQARIPQVT